MSNTKPNYIADFVGRVRKIDNMTLKEVNDHLFMLSSETKWRHKQLKALYTRRSVLMKEPIEQDKPTRKMLEWVKYKQYKPESEMRYKQILELCLTMFDDGKASLELIEAILRQVKAE